MRQPYGPLDAKNQPVTLLAVMMFLVAAVGVPSQLMLQDTLKSAIIAFGVLGAGLVFFWQSRNRSEPLAWHGMLWLPIVLMLYSLGSMVWSHTYLAGVEAIRWFIIGLLMWLGLNALTRENAPLLLWGIHAGAVVASVWAVLQFWLDWSLFPQGPQPASTFINRNFFAEYAVSVLPLSVYLLANLRSPRWLTWMAASLALNVVAVLMTGTRSALLALLVLVPLMLLALLRYWPQLAFPSWSRRHQTLVGLVLVAGIAGLGSVPSSNPKILQEQTGTTALQRGLLRTASMAESKEYSERSFSVRAAMWKATARMIIANAWTGVGAGAWEVQIPLYQRLSTATETDYFAHNEVLQLLSEYGLVVGGLTMTVLLAYLLQTAGALRNDHACHQKGAALKAFTLTSLLGLSIVAMAGFVLHLAASAALFAVLLAILIGQNAPQPRTVAASETQPTSDAAPMARRAVLAMLGAATALAGYISWQAAQAEHKIVRAMQLASFIAQSRPPDGQVVADAKDALRKTLFEGMALNPHYRRLISPVADYMAVSGDWASAVPVWESVAASRPHVTAIWSNLTDGYSQLGQHHEALRTLKEVKRLKPDAMATHVLEVITLTQAGQTETAAGLLNSYFDQNLYDYELVQTGYLIGINTRNWALAIRSLHIRNTVWPEQAADGWMRLGNIYANPEMQQPSKALAAFKAGLSTLPEAKRAGYVAQVPLRYRRAM
jgi:O-antigen ligase